MDFRSLPSVDLVEIMRDIHLTSVQMILMNLFSNGLWKLLNRDGAAGTFSQSLRVRN